MKICFKGLASWRSRARRQRGAATVEFALIIPIFLLIIMGIIEFAMIGFHKLSLTQAARAGSRAASLGKKVSDVVKTTHDAVYTDKDHYVINIPDNNIAVEYSMDGKAWAPLSDGATGNAAPPDSMVRVRIVNWPHPMITGKFFSWLPGVQNENLLMNAQMVMRRE